MSVITTASGLQYEDTREGQGSPAQAGQTVQVHYTGWLHEGPLHGGQTGAKFDSSHDRAQAFVFRLGAGMVIAGWDEGVAGMKPGGRRTLLIPFFPKADGNPEHGKDKDARR